ncbi:hypothetical protein EJB05_26155 [Eragrostis curvula]|uniref:Rx N-terminal domain-containing protein n=1 Tax=Eragrostis curvula TaxID=38414 RepID=A0A5J9UJ22_9POAL|nr:hypothetical protein EJB05_26155 [Eragrostis curvula]
MELAVGAMANLAPKLGKLLMDEYVVQKGLKPDIQSLSTELLAMHAALVDASQVPPDQRSEMDKFWARQVQELSYDMEDAVDDFAVRVAGRDSTAATDANAFKKVLSKATTVVRKAKDRHKIADKIKDIRKLSSELAELRAKYTVRDEGANLAATTGIDPRIINLYKKESDLVGIKEIRDNVIRMLREAKGHADESESLKIVSIVGVGGLGKTTLAKTVHDTLKNQFHCCAFIAVGRTPNFTKIFEKMLLQLDEKLDEKYSNRTGMAGWDLEQFWNELHKLLRNKSQHTKHIPKGTMDMPEVLRSLHIENSEIENMAPLHSFRVCRVVYIVYSNVPINLNHLGRLLHLKYIEISYTPIDELPKEIRHLKSLVALYLIETGLDELPPAVCSLAQLLCLVVYGFKRLPTERMGKLTSLEELQLRDVVGRRATEDLVVELGKLTRLRVVAINFSEEIEESLQKPLVQSLCNLGELQELMVYFAGSELGATIWESWEPPRKLRRLLIEGIKFLRLPRWINSSCLPHIYFISLHVRVVEVHDLDNLARLPELSYLKLGGSSWPPGYIVGTDGFKNLRFCDVGTALKFHPGAAQRLEELKFVVYPKLDSSLVNGVPVKQLPTKDVIGDLDFGLDNLLSLEQVTISILCFNATATEVQGVEAVVSRAVEDHPNHPTINVHRRREEAMCDVDIVKVARAIGVLLWKDESDANFTRLLSPYPRLQEAVFHIYCEGASMGEVEKVEAAFTHAAETPSRKLTTLLVRCLQACRVPMSSLT